MADFAFSNIKPAPCRKFCCPIKNGEYWSMGLPILSPDNIGDDTDIIRNEGCGVIYNLDDYDFALNLLQNDFLNKDSSIVKEKMRQVALKYRSFEHTQKCLDKILHS
jgi:hypothetical protein